jgi:hypothetical protein
MMMVILPCMHWKTDNTKFTRSAFILDKQIAEKDFWAEAFNESFLDEHVASKLDIEQAALIWGFGENSKMCS